MRAAWYERKGPAREVLVVGEASDPRPGPGEVRLRVRASGVNPGDVKKRQVWLGFAEMPYPRVIPHSDGAGVIDEVGPGVSPSRVGERAWCYGAQSYRPFGTAAEYVVLPERLALPLPAGVSFEIGACFGIPGLTAHRCVFSDGPVAGARVLVQGGAGAVGAFASQLARQGGATVVATVRRASQAEAAREAGAHHVVVLGAEGEGELRRLAGPGGFDRIVEVALGANAALDAELLKQGGVIAAYSSDRDPEPRLPFWPLLFQNATLRLLGSDDFPPEAKAEAALAINRALEGGWPGPPIAERLPLDEIARAHEAVEAGGHAGRVVLTIGA